MNHIFCNKQDIQLYNGNTPLVEGTLKSNNIQLHSTLIAKYTMKVVKFLPSSISEGYWYCCYVTELSLESLKNDLNMNLLYPVTHLVIHFSFDLINESKKQMLEIIRDQVYPDLKWLCIINGNCSVNDASNMFLRGKPMLSTILVLNEVIDKSFVSYISLGSLFNLKKNVATGEAREVNQATNEAKPILDVTLGAQSQTIEDRRENNLVQNGEITNNDKTRSQVEDSTESCNADDHNASGVLGIESDMVDHIQQAVNESTNNPQCNEEENVRQIKEPKVNQNEDQSNEQHEQHEDQSTEQQQEDQQLIQGEQDNEQDVRGEQNEDQVNEHEDHNIEQQQEDRQSVQDEQNDEQDNEQVVRDEQNDDQSTEQQQEDQQLIQGEQDDEQDVRGEQNEDQVNEHEDHNIEQQHDDQSTEQQHDEQEVEQKNREGEQDNGTLSNITSIKKLVIAGTLNDSQFYLRLSFPILVVAPIVPLFDFTKQKHLYKGYTYSSDVFSRTSSYSSIKDRSSLPNELDPGSFIHAFFIHTNRKYSIWCSLDAPSDLIRNGIAAILCCYGVYVCEDDILLSVNNLPLTTSLRDINAKDETMIVIKVVKNSQLNPWDQIVEETKEDLKTKVASVPYSVNLEELLEKYALFTVTTLTIHLDSVSTSCPAFVMLCKTPLPHLEELIIFTSSGNSEKSSMLFSVMHPSLKCIRVCCRS